MSRSRHLGMFAFVACALLVAGCVPSQQTVAPVPLAEPTSTTVPSVTVTSSEPSACANETTTGEAVFSKPVIYLYPPRETRAVVRLSVDGAITHTEPAIGPENTWRVLARPDGLLIDGSGRSFPYLFWEADASATFDVSTGFVIPGGATQRFLAKKLKALGLNDGEAAAFMDYWVPRMEANPYNLIHFEGPAYEKVARLAVAPAPETQIRVFMVFRRLDAPIAVRQQELPAPPARRGFTLVEWGGAELQAR